MSNLYRNGRSGQIVSIPQAALNDSVLQSAHNCQWIESILGHAAEEAEDAAEWMTLYLTKHHESPFVLGAAESGLPIVNRMVH